MGDGGRREGYGDSVATFDSQLAGMRAGTLWGQHVPPDEMYRREYVHRLGVVGAASTMGCLGSGSGSGGSTVTLDSPDRDIESSELPYLAWGERVPDVTLPAPLEDRSVALREVGKPTLLTYFYSHCQTVCPVLISTMRNVQTHALNNGYGDEVAIFPVTFDPARDTADRLREYADRMNVDADAGNWHFLRPSSPDRAREVVQEEFGVAFTRQTPEDMDRYMFVHVPMTTLVNERGYVERGYRTKTPDVDRILDDLETVRMA